MKKKLSSFLAVLMALAVLFCLPGCEVSEEELARRKAAWKAPDLKIPNGYLRMYAKMASSADQGAILR